MRRYYLKKGDRSSADGVILEGEETCTHYGTALAYLGAKIYCNTCKTEGFIAGKGPRLSDRIMGKESALDGDICICKCDPPPVLIASQDTDCQEVDAEAFTRRLVEEKSSQTDKAVNTSSDRKYSRRVFVWDSVTGEPLKNRRFIADVGGEQQSGRTDADGYATVETGDSKMFRIHVVFSSPKRDLTPSEGA